MNTHKNLQMEMLNLLKIMIELNLLSIENVNKLYEQTS